MGYRHSRTFGKGTTYVFNPFSLLNCFFDGKLDSYRFGTGTPTYLINMMWKFGVKPSQLGAVRTKVSSFYTLDIPNNEIRVELFDGLLLGYTGAEGE